jgi:tetratricopeptide (TPR) repeat protein
MTQKVNNSKEKKKKSIISNKPENKSGSNLSQLKFSLSFKDPKFRAFLPFAIAIIIFLWIWTKPGDEVVDPWYKAALKVDSSRKTFDPALKVKLLNEGGDELRELVKKYPFHARVHYLLGFYYMTAQKLDSAITEFRTTIKIDSGATINPVAPDAARSLVSIVINKSNLQIQQHDYKNALETLGLVNDFAASSPDILNQYGYIFHSQGMLDSAIYFYDKVLKIDPNYNQTLKNMALAYWVKGNAELNMKKPIIATDFYNKALIYDKSNADIYTNLAIAYIQQNQVEKAVDFFMKSIEINPNNKIALQNLINIYTKKGDENSAKLYQQRLSTLSGK